MRAEKEDRLALATEFRFLANFPPSFLPFSVSFFHLKFFQLLFEKMAKGGYISLWDNRWRCLSGWRIIRICIEEEEEEEEDGIGRVCFTSP